MTDASPYGEQCPATSAGQPCITRMPYRHDHPTWPHVAQHDGHMRSWWEPLTADWADEQVRS